MAIETNRRSFLIGLGALFAAPAIPFIAPTPTIIRLDSSFGDVRRIFSISVVPDDDGPLPMDFARNFIIRRPQNDLPLMQVGLHSRGTYRWRTMSSMDDIVVMPGADVLVEVVPLRGGVFIELDSQTSRGVIQETFVWRDDKLTINEPVPMEIQS